MTAEEIAGPLGGVASVTYGELTVDVSAERWVAAATAARDELAFDFFDWLSGVDELPDGFAVVTHLYSLSGRRRVLLRTRLPRAGATLDTLTGVYAGAAWHERETHEMFGIAFAGHPGLDPLLLPDGFAGHPLRKDFVLAARVAKEWPGAVEPGGGRRRRVRPLGVPEGWGPDG